MDDHSDLRLLVEDRVATLTLARPGKLNAMTAEMTKTLWGYAQVINSEPDIRVVVLTGDGDKSFCVGSDIAQLDAYATAWEFRNRLEYCDAVRAVRKPIIAAVNGYAYGGGLELAMSCDIRIASTSATFAAPEIKLGWVGGGGQAAFLAHSIGPSNAALLLLTGDPISAEEARALGLVSRLLSPSNLKSNAMELAATIAERPPIAAQTAKLDLRAAYAMTLENCIQYERDLQTVCFSTEDAIEGRAAFTGKRQATFRGR